MSAAKSQSYTFLHQVDVQRVLDDIRDPNLSRVQYGGYTVSVGGSLRLRTFAEKGTVCSACGLEGTQFWVNNHKNSKVSSTHLNLWGVEKSGKLMLMTHDHTLARSLGGTDAIDNCTTMCSRCNWNKSKVEVTLREGLYTKTERRQLTKANRATRMRDRMAIDPVYKATVERYQRELGRNDFPDLFPQS